MPRASAQDFEPRWRAFPQDRAGLLGFVDQLSAAMHVHGKVVSIDASPCVDPTWEGVKWQNNCMWWDPAAYNESKVDSFCNMFTYSKLTSLFTREIVADINSFGINSSKIGLGLDSQYKPTLTDDELSVRFQLIEQLGIKEVLPPL